MRFLSVPDPAAARANQHSGCIFAEPGRVHHENVAGSYPVDVLPYLTLRKRELLLLLAVCRLIALDLESLVEKLMIGDVQIDISRIDFITWHLTLTLLYFPPHGTSSACGWASYSIMSIEKDSPFRKLAVSGCDLA